MTLSAQNPVLVAVHIIQHKLHIPAYHVCICQGASKNIQELGAHQIIEITIEMLCIVSSAHYHWYAALSPTMTQGNLAVWSKKEGDQLAPGEVIAEIETDKAQMDFEFQEDGYLAKILVPEGTKDIPVNKPIAVYVEDKDDVAAFKDFKLEDSGSDAKTSTKAQPAESQGAKKQDAPSEKAKSPAPEAKERTTAAPQGRVFASPLAKTIALEKGIALKDVQGTRPPW